MVGFCQHFRHSISIEPKATEEAGGTWKKNTHTHEGIALASYKMHPVAFGWHIYLLPTTINNFIKFT